MKSNLLDALAQLFPLGLQIRVALGMLDVAVYSNPGG